MPSRILVVDTGADALTLESDLAARGFHVSIVRSITLAVALVDAAHFDAIVCALDLGGRSGLDVVRTVVAHEDGRVARTPVLLVAQQALPAHKVEAFQTGAFDCIDKGCDPDELAARLVRSIERHKREELWVTRACQDPLTGVFNRGALMERLSRFAPSPKAGLACVMFDLDHFKRVNDTHGHAAGDSVLKRAVEVVRGNLRGHDLVGRMGGEEFLMLLPRATLADAVRAAERVRASLATSPIAVPETYLQVTASFGVVLLLPRETAEAVIARADAAMYVAKHAGRNRVAFEENGVVEIVA
jgi:diguanylate cyclase (GGDEF)-like protein